MKTRIRVAIAGLGSCASSLLQLVSKARAQVGTALEGVGHPRIGGFTISDIDFVAAFDVDREKIGCDLADAAFAGANAAKRYFEVPHQDVRVVAGPLADGLEGELARVVTPHPDSKNCDTAKLETSLRDSKTDVLVCHLPTGASKAIKVYAEVAARAGMAFINTTPERIARDPYFQRIFYDSGGQLLGDDTKSLLGATTFHMALIELLLSKRVEIAGTYQINVGGNTDFLNLSDRVRSASKVSSKRTALAGAGIDSARILAGPNGFVEHLGDTKICHLNIEGRSVLGSPLLLDLKLQVEDSPNSAGVIVDAIRVAMAARERGCRGNIAQPCALLFKSPPFPVTYSESVRLFEAFIAEVADESLANDRVADGGSFGAARPR
jgi:myo-inositol-1-phosphate synthase